ncbi:MAG: NYN domain-containing protein [Clostridiales bacterium]|nr:NYN domain-containing protein [Clostridiales bacterium]
MKPLLIVDGYNVIGAWGEAERSDWSLDDCRDQLLRRLQDYAGYSGEEIVLVYDGYQSDKKMTTVQQYGLVSQVFTRHGETADSYIERLVALTPRYRLVRVATSDGLEQSQVLSTGATRLTSRELLRELGQIRSNGIQHHRQQTMWQKNPLGARLDDDTLAILEKIRRSDK